MPRADKLASLVVSRTEAVKTAEYKPLFSKLRPQDCCPTGCTILNLCLSGRMDGGWAWGGIGHIVGDSDTGKTVIAKHTLAEACMLPDTKKIEKIDDEVEQSSSADLLSMFDKYADQFVAPGPNGEVSEMIEDFYGYIYKRLKAGNRFVYVLDSMDMLESKAGVKLFEENIELNEKDKKLKGSYGDGKAKQNSTGLRKLKQKLKSTRSLLLIVSQTRDNMDPMSMNPKTHAGGRALKFCSAYQMWLAPLKKLQKTVLGLQRDIGILTRVRVSKNHVTGAHADFSVPFYYGYGIDDYRCSIQWMVDNGMWKIEKGNLHVGKYAFGLATCDRDLAAFSNTLRTSGPKHPLVLEFQSAIQQGWDLIEKETRAPAGRYSETVTAFDSEDVSFEE